MNFEYGRSRLFPNLPPVVRNIVLINIVVMIATWIGGDRMYGTFALFSFGSPFFRPWQLVTHMFMHGGFWHIFFNMYTLAIFGPVLENQWGSKKFLLFYFVVGIGAALCHNMVMHLQIINASSPAVVQHLMQIPTVGASGAIYGVLLGFAMLFPNAELRLIFLPFFPLKAKWLILIFAGIELLTGVFGSADGVAHFAHLGGMLFALILILIWKKQGQMYN